MAGKFQQNILLNGGINVNADPRVIGENEMVAARNMYPNVSGVMETRPGCVPIYAANGNFNWLCIPDKATGMQVVYGYAAPETTQYVLVAGDSLEYGASNFPHTVTISGVYKPPSAFNYNGETIFTFGAPIEGFYVLGVNGFRRESFAFVIGALTQVQSVEVTPKVAGTYNRRVVWGNFGAGRENMICVADRSYASINFGAEGHTIAIVVGDDVLAEESRSFRLDHLAGDEITAIQEVSLSDVSNPLQIALLILGKQRGLFITGETLQTTDTPPSNGSYYGTAQPNAIGYDCGCFGSNAICTSPEGVFWAGQDNVWFMPKGASPQPIGFNLLPLIRNIAPELHSAVQVKYFDRRIVLGVPSGNEVTTVRSSNEVGHDAALDFYWLDLKTGIQNARWYGPMVYGPFAQYPTSSFDYADADGGVMAIAARNVVGTAPALWGVGYQYDLGGPQASNYSFICDLVPLNPSGLAKDIVEPSFNSSSSSPAPKWQANTDYSVGDVVRALFLRSDYHFQATAVANPAALNLSQNTEPEWNLGGTTSDGDVTWTAVAVTNPTWNRGDAADVIGRSTTKVFDLEAPNLRKTLKVVEAEMFTSAPQKVYCDDIQASGNVTETMAVTLGVSTNAQLDVSTLPFNAGKDFSHRAFRPPNNVTLTSEGHQLSFYPGNGYIIDNTNNTIAMSMLVWFVDDTSVGLVQYYEATIPYGYYANDDAIVIAILAALNANMNSWTPGAGIVNVSPIPTITWGASKERGIWRITATMSNKTLDGCGMSLLFGAPTVDFPIYTRVIAGGGVIFSDPYTGTVNYAKCAKLFSLLGYDITAQIADISTVDITGTESTPFSDTSRVLVPRGLGDTATVLWADAFSAYSRPVNFAIQSAYAEGQILRGRPFTGRDR